ncbi:MAG: tRNA (N(6)-L-threonylcarbamoyladenosine(37)-C(2))-methylthiotransferase MtaB [Lachnospiraceae bacterium]|nr:tRNA (N(6)-L-threonylcarbamoyladenosine(37)-C(2))-methylthiotransferase MtaB [Lachnospiraceae bacterium]
MKKRVAFHNLGCRVNTYETEQMLQSFRDHGYEIVDFNEKAEVYVVNTCTVTRTADKKSRQMIRRAAGISPGAVVVAVGCAVETGGLGKNEAIADLFLGNLQKGDIADIVDEYIATGRKPDTEMMPGHAEDCPSWIGRDASLHLKTSTTRAFVKIQDGCDQFCTYCIIPYARGRSRSRDEDETAKEIGDLVKTGVKEVVLTGIHLSSYGQSERMSGTDPFDPEPLLSLLARIDRIEGLSRIRFGSMEPRFINKSTAERLAAVKKLCPHFHLSLQSGCDATLRRMNRHYGAEDFRESVLCLRDAFDRPAVSADVITGFPGETGEDWETTMEFLRELGLYELHVFPYSERPGTAAASMPGKLPLAVREERCRELIAMNAGQSRLFRESFIGDGESVLWEDAEMIDGKPCLTGFTERYIRAAMPLDEAKKCGITGGIITPGAVTGLMNDDVLAFEPDAGNPDDAA